MKMWVKHLPFARVCCCTPRSVRFLWREGAACAHSEESGHSSIFLTRRHFLDRVLIPTSYSRNLILILQVHIGVLFVRELGVVTLLIIHLLRVQNLIEGVLVLDLLELLNFLLL